jgi:hypothetical protein
MNDDQRALGRNRLAAASRTRSRGLKLRARNLPVQNLQLVAKHHDLKRLVPCNRAEDPANDEVGKRQQWSVLLDSLHGWEL